MGGTVGEKLGTKEIAEGAQRRAQNYYHKEMAGGIEETGNHWGRQTGLLMDGVNHAANETMKFFERNTRSLMPQDGGGNNEAQTASANYTGQASTQKSGSGTRSSGKLSSNKKKSGKGKKALTITK